MSRFDALPPLVLVLVAVLLILGSTLAFLGAVGLIRLRSFYQRLHAPTLGTTLGVTLIAMASALLFSFLGGRVVLHELVIVMLVVATTPATLITLGRAALRRDRTKEDPTLPPVQRAPFTPPRD
ncbi:monovalent cation/H(+) antiporter subunit G [Pontibaca methylaminivorans]|uniref:monovalent cation/H(+) antiporter subunit G n=1 Tax=Pontibaca methylaminivorans TaxID=515897 RepID=UPI002FD941A7